MAQLEHVNFTVVDAKATAAVLVDLFDWHIRWEGSAMNGEGYTVHVGTDSGYLAVYAPNYDIKAGTRDYDTSGGMNHIGIVVEDLDAAEARVKAAGFTPRSHADYEPGKRFYFDGPDGVEYELVSYG